MDLTAKNTTQCRLLLAVFQEHIIFLLNKKKECEEKLENLKGDESELDLLEKELEEVAVIIFRIEDYHKAYPDTKDNYFYTKLSNEETKHFIRSIDIYRNTHKDKLLAEESECLDFFLKQAENFVDSFVDVEYSQEYVLSLLDDYKRELKGYCESSIERIVENGNPEIYVFYLQTFPGHHYQLVAANTVEGMSSESSKMDPFEEARYYGYDSELYNPACAAIEARYTEAFDVVSKRVEELFGQFYTMTDSYGDGFEKGSSEYENIKKLEALANRLIIEHSVTVLNEVDFSKLNRSENFCALIASHEFSKEEFYTLAKRTIPQDQFDNIFPNAFREALDYIDLENCSEDEKASYLVQYITDYSLQTIPDGRYYTSDKAYSYQRILSRIGCEKDKYILEKLEKLIEDAPVNPKDPSVKYYINLFTNEGRLFTDLMNAYRRTKDFSSGVEERFVELFKKTIVGYNLKDDRDCIVGPSSIASILHQINPQKYPTPDFDLESMMIKNYQEFLK